MIHLVLAPEHMAEAQGQGLFFIALGVVQLTLGLALLRHEAALPARAAFVATLASIVLYVATRFLPQPFSDGSEAVDATGVATNLVELAALAACTVALARLPARTTGAASGSARPAVAVAVLIVAGLAVAGGLYGLGVVLEEAVPALSEGSEHSHDDVHAHTARPAMATTAGAAAGAAGGVSLAGRTP